MTENKKTEKWSSLRLDLQQFSPQEYFATCYDITVRCSSSGEYSVVVANGSDHSHSGGPHTKTFTVSLISEPIQVGDVSGMSFIYSATAGKNNGHKTDYKGYAWQDGSSWHFITSFSSVVSSDANVSG